MRSLRNSSIMDIFGNLAIVIIPIYLLILWSIVSLVVSGVKAVSGTCGTKIVIEKVFAGDWMCEDKDVLDH